MEVKKIAIAGLLLSIVSILLGGYHEIAKAPVELAFNALIKAEEAGEAAKKAANAAAAAAEAFSESSQKIEKTNKKADNALTAAQKADKIAQDAIAKIRSTTETLKDINKKIKVIENVTIKGNWIFVCKTPQGEKEMAYPKNKNTKEEAIKTYNEDCK